jgi:hypothetical protein
MTNFAASQITILNVFFSLTKDGNKITLFKTGATRTNVEQLMKAKQSKETVIFRCRWQLRQIPFF